MSQLLFVCGFPSGGTDLTKTILNAHPDIFINGEMPFLRHISQHGYSANTVFTTTAEIVALQNLLRESDTWGNIENVEADFSAALYETGSLSLSQVMEQLFSEKRPLIWGNKTPQNTEHMATLATLFPSAKFLVVTRDVREVCLSWRNKWGRHLYWCAAKWGERMAKGWQVSQGLPSSQVLWVRFEDLLQETETTCRQLCDFLAVPFSERMLAHHQYTTQVVAGKLNYGQAIKQDNAAKWRQQLKPAEIRRIEAIAFETMALLGYEVEQAEGKRPFTPTQKRLAQLHDAAAMVLVGNRANKTQGWRGRWRGVAHELKKLRAR